MGMQGKDPSVWGPASRTYADRGVWDVWRKGRLLSVDATCRESEERRGEERRGAGCGGCTGDADAGGEVTGVEWGKRSRTYVVCGTYVAGESGIWGGVARRQPRAAGVGSASRAYDDGLEALGALGALGALSAFGCHLLWVSWEIWWQNNYPGSERTEPNEPRT